MKKSSVIGLIGFFILMNAGCGENKSLTMVDPVLSPSMGTESVIQPMAERTEGEIHLELTSNRGDGATFVEGEKVQYLVSSDREAYLVLIYKDASGRLMQIYPNHRSGIGLHPAGEYLSIPDKTSTFDFKITPPFGLEEVWAFASSTPFLSLKGKGLLNGLTILEQDLAQVKALLRANGQKPGVSYGEAHVVITTVKE